MVEITLSSVVVKCAFPNFTVDIIEKFRDKFPVAKRERARYIVARFQKIQHPSTSSGFMNLKI